MATSQSGQASSQSMPLHPPYPPKFAALGLVPTVGVDVPIVSVFLALFIGAAVGHMTIFQLNKKRGHKFLISGMCFGFCMARIVTCIMRIVWATKPTNIRVAIAAQIFVTAGVILLFIVNLIFAQRLVRAAHPNFGWHHAFSMTLKVMYALIVIILAMLITVTVQTFYTLNPNTRRIDRDIQLFGGTFYTVISFLPIPLVVGGLIIPRKTRVEKFGTGRWRSKVTILLTATFLLCLGACFRTGTNYKNPRPRTNPAWYQSKACFYIFNLTVEIITIYLYLVVRIDRRFHIPNGSRGPGDYSGQNALEKDSEVPGTPSGHPKVLRRILTEEEVFDDEMAPEEKSRLEKEQERNTSV